MFLCAKVASAATAALGFAGYLLNALAHDPRWMPYVAAATVVGLTLVVLAGVKLSSRVNAAIVLTTLTALAAFVMGGLPAVKAENLAFSLEPRPLLHACALMFVAFTGYGRIATLGEEVIEPRRTIPRAIVATLAVSAFVYVAVAVVGVGAAGAEALSRAATSNAAPLEVVARQFPLPVHGVVAVGAMTAMLGVLLNLILGLSRVLLAMGRRGDMPRGVENVNVAVVVVGVGIAALAAVGSVKAAWSFSAFTVLVYYAITNLAALRLSAGERLYSPLWARMGLVACLSLAFAVDAKTWLSGIGVLLAGLAWHALRRM
jgi:APA family basic amino acid/polyamine antiporter